MSEDQKKKKKRIRVDDDDAEEEEEEEKAEEEGEESHVQVVRSVWVLTRFFFPRRNDLKSALLS